MVELRVDPVWGASHLNDAEGKIANRRQCKGEEIGVSPGLKGETEVGLSLQLASLQLKQ